VSPDPNPPKRKPLKFPLKVVTLNLMKIWRYLLLLLLILAVCGYVYSNREDFGLDSGEGHSFSSFFSGHSASAEHTAPLKDFHWQQENRTADGFRVDLPGEANEVQIPAYNEQGGADQVRMMLSNPGPNITYSISWAANPPVARIAGRTPMQVLNAARDGALSRTQTQLVKESDLTVAGIPALDFDARNNSGGYLSTRLIFNGTTLYMLTASYPSMQNFRQQDVQRFQNSFAITATYAPAAKPEAARNARM